VFARSWQLVAHAAQLADAGDHVVADIAGVPLVILRGDDGELRALHNVCRHRAGPLASCDGRGAKRLRCQYHGWTYALDGRLLSAPEMGDAQDFAIDAIRLPQARVAQWRGLVFAALDGATSFADVVDGIDARVGAAAMHGYAFARRIAYDIDCDWKVYVDNYLEGYHVPHIHPELNRMLDYRSYVTELARWHSLQWSPLESTGDLYGNGEALYYWLWPNTMLNILPGRVQTNRVLPLAGIAVASNSTSTIRATPTPRGTNATSPSATSCSRKTSTFASACSAGLPQARTSPAGSIRSGKAACIISTNCCARRIARCDDVTARS
jgi:choline monooxygenase